VGGESVDLLHVRGEGGREHRPATAARQPQQPGGIARPARAFRRCQRPARTCGCRQFITACAAARAGHGQAHHHRPEHLSQNLMPVTYVIGDVAGVVESPVYAI